jgi:hypothetical protein
MLKDDSGIVQAFARRAAHLVSAIPASVGGF